MINKNVLQFLETLKNEKRINDYTVKKIVCAMPFTYIKIHDNGNVYTCCASYIKHNRIGNIFENDLAEIWNGKAAKELRKRIKNGDYSMCDLKLCRSRSPVEISKVQNGCPFPKYVNLSYDKECNLNCITCRDEKYQNSEEKRAFYNDKMPALILPLLKEAEEISISAYGEALYSKHSRELIKRIAQENKKVKFRIYTNGLLFNDGNLKALGIKNRVNEVFISLPAIDKTV